MGDGEAECDESERIGAHLVLACHLGPISGRLNGCAKVKSGDWIWPISGQNVCWTLHGLHPSSHSLTPLDFTLIVLDPDSPVKDGFFTEAQRY